MVVGGADPAVLVPVDGAVPVGLPVVVGAAAACTLVGTSGCASGVATTIGGALIIGGVSVGFFGALGALASGCFGLSIGISVIVLMCVTTIGSEIITGSFLSENELMMKKIPPTKTTPQTKALPVV